MLLFRTSCRGNLTVRAVPLTTVWTRNVSLTSAINSGVRKAADALKKAERRRIQEGTLAPWELKDKEKVSQMREYAARKQYGRDVERQRLEFLSRGSEQLSDESESRRPFGDRERERRNQVNARARAQGMLVDAPQSVPYTEAASEFLYGTFSVLSALSARKRKLHKLYIWCGEDGRLVDSDNDVTEIVRLANRADVPILRVAGNWDKMLDRMSDRRPHNGVVLEAGAIPKVQAKSLGRVNAPGDSIRVNLQNMHPDEKEALGLKANSQELELDATKDRYPLMLWLDKVTDTGNLGAILRSAYFMGIDAIIMPRHGTASLTAMAIKTSAGAAERVPIILINNETEFMVMCKEQGWKFYAAGAVESKSTLKASRNSSPRKKVEDSTDSSLAEPPATALKHHPCILMLGNEGEGLRPFLQKLAHCNVSIPSARSDGVVDSLNVSVAAALLAHHFLSDAAVVHNLSV